MTAFCHTAGLTLTRIRVARGIRVWEVADTVAPDAFGELHRQARPVAVVAPRVPELAPELALRVLAAVCAFELQLAVLRPISGIIAQGPRGSPHGCSLGWILLRHRVCPSARHQGCIRGSWVGSAYVAGQP